jgi:hypothetical protein
MMFFRTTILPFLSLSILAGAAPKNGTTYLYTYYDRNGSIVINNLPPSYMRGQGMTLKGVGVGHVRLAISRSEMARVLKSPEMLAMVDEISNSIGVDPFLARAIIQAESAFNYKARSHAGALGLMQLMPKTAERFGVIDPFDPRQNITGGTKYLKYLLSYYKGDLSRVIAAYNAGEGAVDRHKGIPPFRETQAYVPRVMELYTKRLVQADPKAAGAMELLKKGRGGFEIPDEKALPKDAKTKPGSSLELVSAPPSPPRVATPIFQWTDPASGRVQISSDPPPRGAKNVKVYRGTSD